MSFVHLITPFILLFPLSVFGMEKPNLILISVDTLRADHLGCYGYYRNTSPEIDALAREGILFENCLTESPLTVPAMATIMTSLPAYKHGAKRNGLSIYEGLKTLAEQVKAHGYRSAGFISNWPLKDRLSGLGKGFDHFEEIFTKKRWMGVVNPEGEAPDVNRAVKAWLEKEGNTGIPLFIWIHYTEPHAPYILHQEYQFPPFSKEKHGRNAKEKRINPYDSEIAFTDHHIGKILNTFRKRGMYDSSIILFVSDHGESFGEHRYYQHGRRLYNTCLHVPLIIRLPGAVRAKTRIAGLSSLIDVAPTLLVSAGLPIGSWMEGQDLLSEGYRKDFVFSEAYKGAALLKRGEHFKRKVHPIRFAISTPEFKLIYNQSVNRFEAYQPAHDRFEDQDIFKPGHEGLRDLRLRLIDHIRDLNSYLKLGEKKYKQPAKMTQDDLDKLKSLGYID